jgi:hypothetical protein
MAFSSFKLLALAAAVASTPLLVQPAAAQSGRDDGVSITIRKAPSYLNTRTIARPNSRASYDTSALYQSSFASRNNLNTSRYPLPSTFDLPGY